MLKKINEITGYTLLAQEGEIGRCHDFLFDDRTWVIRYMVVKTAKWLPARKVIVSPVFLDEPDWANKRLAVRLTRQEIEGSPSLDEHAPVSRQYEINYHQHYALPFYWVGHDLWGTYPDPYGVIHPVSDQALLEVETSQVEENHLRSTEEVIGYHIAATDGGVGHVEDFLIDDNSWALRYLVVDTKNWLPGHKVLLSPQWIESIDWVNKTVRVDLNTETIKSCPEFDPSQPVNRRYEVVLYDYYGRPYEWKQ